MEAEPPYAVLNSQDFDEEESEEGYETIPVSERRSTTARKDSNEVMMGTFLRGRSNVTSYIKYLSLTSVKCELLM